MGLSSTLEIIIKAHMGCHYRPKEYHYEQSVVLVAATLEGNLRKVQQLIEEGVDFISPGFGGQIPLLIAAEKGFLDIVQLFVDKGAQIDSCDNKGMTALMFAAQKGHSELVHYLLKKGMAINSFDGYDRRLQHYVFDSGNQELINYFIDHPEVDLNDQDPLKEGRTLLHRAVSDSKESIIRKLMKARGINPYQADFSGANPLILACMNRDLFSCKLLLDCGFRFSMDHLSKALNPFYIVFSHLPFLLDNRRMILFELLFDHLTDPNHSDLEGHSALHAAAECGGIRAVECLFSKKKPLLIDQQNNRGMTPFHLAVAAGDFETVRYLLSLKVDPSIPDHEGTTPLLTAKKYYFFNIMDLIIERLVADELESIPLRQC